MNETQVHTLEMVRRVVEGPEALEFRRCEDEQGRYAWIESVLRRIDFRQISRQDRALVLDCQPRDSVTSMSNYDRCGSKSAVLPCTDTVDTVGAFHRQGVPAAPCIRTTAARRSLGHQ